MTGSDGDTEERSELRILTFSTLYPNAAMPQHGLFVEQRLRQLLARHPVNSRVVAPVPWFPLRSSLFGKYAVHAAVPKFERRHEIPILHPRYPVLPKVGMSVAPVLMALAVYRALKACSHDSIGFDVIDAHYFYPDGVAAAILGGWLGKPVTVTARGTDVNLIPEYRMPRKWILWAAKRCAKIISVSNSLRTRLIEIGVAGEMIVTLRNGVDLEVFRPRSDREALRAELGITGPTILSVGHLIELKGHHVIIEALAKLPGVNLAVVGDGPMKHGLANLVSQLGLQHRVTFAGELTQKELAKYYCSADALVLASSREGMANVLLEALACGTPVVATPYGGNPEVVANPSAGILTDDRTPWAVADAVRKLLQDPPYRDAVRKYAEKFGWDLTSNGQFRILRNAAQAWSTRNRNSIGGQLRGSSDEDD